MQKLKSIDGLYSAIAAIIKEREDTGRYAMDVESIIEDVKHEVDIYSAEREWYIRTALLAAVEVGLYQKGYRSVVKGEGLFVNPHICDRPEYLSRLFNNASLSVKQKERALDLLKKIIKTSGIEGQLRFDMDGTIFEDVTEKQLLDMLRMNA